MRKTHGDLNKTSNDSKKTHFYQHEMIRLWNVDSQNMHIFITKSRIQIFEFDFCDIISEQAAIVTPLALARLFKLSIIRMCLICSYGLCSLQYLRSQLKNTNQAHKWINQFNSAIIVGDLLNHGRCKHIYFRSMGVSRWASMGVEYCWQVSRYDRMCAIVNVINDSN